MNENKKCITCKEVVNEDEYHVWNFNPRKNPNVFCESFKKIEAKFVYNPPRAETKIETTNNE